MECEAERKKFGVFSGTDDQNCEVFKIPKRKFKSNQGISGEQCIRNGNESVLAVSVDNKKLAWKSDPEKLLNRDFI